MCFKKPKPDAPIVITGTVTYPAESNLLPHPQEPMDVNATIQSVNIEFVRSAWFLKWGVPLFYQDFWRQAKLVVIFPAMFPAYTILETNTIWFDPRWANSGTMAHEMAHLQWGFLSVDMRNGFAVEHETAKQTDSLVQLLYRLNSYGTQSDIEGHAEIYRYLGDKMPPYLRKYYPKLIA